MSSTIHSTRSIRLERWRPLIEASRSEDALAAVMREYCDTLLPSDLAKLPEASPTCAVLSVADIGAAKEAAPPHAADEGQIKVTSPRR